MACHDRVICPAFQSTYILDDSTRYAFYSYVWQLDETTRNEFLGRNDTYADSLSTPDDSLNSTSGSPKVDYYAYAEEKVVPWRVRGRTKYGVVKYEPYWLKKYRMRTAPMENVFAPKPPKEEEPLVAAADTLTVGDSISVASADSLQAEAVASTSSDEDEVRFLYKYDPNDNFNVEQEYYNKHFGKRLIDNRPPPAPEPVDSLSNVPDSLQKEPFFKGLFKNLFKKKENESDTTLTDSLDVEPLEEESEEEEEASEKENDGQ
ncbi:MAG: hypothetical protein AAGA66_19295 [Bacteroidota bacterium]